jgi:hypothetical protein
MRIETDWPENGGLSGLPNKEVRARVKQVVARFRQEELHNSATVQCEGMELAVGWLELGRAVKAGGL